MRRTRRSAGTVCSKCDGEHADEDCPHFRGPRGTHEDCQIKPMDQRSPPTENVTPVVARGEVCKADASRGNCLYISLTRAMDGIVQRLGPWALRHQGSGTSGGAGKAAWREGQGQKAGISSP